MSSSATRIRRGRLVDTIGVLAVVAGMILGLVPGISAPAARADASCQDANAPGNDRGFIELMLELEDANGDILVIDTDDDDVTCTFVNAVSVFKGGIQVVAVADADGGGLKDAPGYHTSCSEDYQGATIEYDGTQYTVLEWRMVADDGGKVCGTPPPLTISKVDADGNGLAGAEFTLYEEGGIQDGQGVPKDGKATFTCTTDAAGTCEFTGIDAKTKYVLDETVVPAGYKKAPGVPVEIEPDKDGYAYSFTDPRIEYEIDVEPNGRNAVGNEHEFTVTLTADGAPLANATVGLDWSGVGSITNPGSSCTTDAAGQCTVTVDSDDPGSGELTASFDTPYSADNGQTNGPNFDPAKPVGTSGTAYDAIADGGRKTWVGYEAEISPDDTNLLGDLHPFTVTVYEVDGAGSPDRVIAPNVDVVVSWNGTPAGSTLDTTTCTTDAAGECVFTVDSDTNAGNGTLQVESVAGTPSGTSESLTVSFADGEVDATKTWREYRAIIDDDSVNPVGTTHEFTVQVQYREAPSSSWTNAGADLTVDWTSTGAVGVDDLGSSTCDDGTDADGRCSIVVFSDVAGDRTVTVDSVTGQLLSTGGDRTYVFRDAAYASAPTNADDTATKTWESFGANIEPTAHNKVGEPHTFTVTVFRFDGSGNEIGVPNGTKVTTNLDWTPTDPSNEVVANTCATTGTVNDECTITVNTGVGGAVTATVLGLEDYTFNSTTQDVTFDNQPSAVKTWYEYRAWIEPDETALVNTELTYYVTAEQNSGSGWVPVPQGTTVGLSDSGLDAILSESCSTGTGDDPRTLGTETNVCTVVTNSPVPGSIDVKVETVSADAAVDSPGPVTVTEDNLPAGKSLTATKTWVEYYTDIEPDEVALTGTTLTYYVTVTQDAGAGRIPVPAGTEVRISDDNLGITPTGASTCPAGTGDDPRTPGVTETNVCTVVVHSDVVDEVTTSIDEVQALAVDLTGGTWATFPDGNLQVTPGGTRTATKTWIEIGVDVDADETNIVGEMHRFEVDVTLFTPTDPGGTAAPNGTTVDVSTGVTDVGSVTGQTCDAPGTDAGTCTVTVNSSEPGTLTVSADSVDFTYADQPFTVDFTDTSTAGEASSQDLTATKTWRAYRASLVPDSLDLVRNAQSATATIEQTDVANPTDADWSPVPSGTTATVDNAAGVGTIDPAAGTCETTGTDASGDCTAIANSPLAGTGTFEVTDITVEHPESASPTTVDAGAGLTTTDTVDKTWIAFRSTITPDAVNVTGDEHLFEVSTEYTADGTTWTPVPNGTQVDVSATGTGDIIDTGTFDTTCEAGIAGDGEGTTDGVCDVWVDSDTAGNLDVSVDGLTATVTENGITGTFDVVYGRDASNVPNPGLLDGFDQTDRSGDGDDYESTKTWASYRLRLNPPTAVNLLDGSDDDPEKNHEITAILTSDNAATAPVGNQTIDLSVDTGATFSDGSSTTTCTTAADGTCTVVITSDGPSQATVTGSYDGTVGATPVTIDAENDAVKTWTTFRVNVTPDQAVNVAGSPHVFTVTIEESSPAADCGDPWCAVEGATPDIQVSGTDLTVDTSDCDAGTDANGECDVVVTSQTVQAITLTATHTESYQDYDTEISGTAGAAFSDDGDKDWIDYAINVDPPEDENLAGTDHVFTVTLETTFPTASGTQTDPVVGAVPTITLGGDVGAVTDNDCDNGTDADGQCTVTITSSAAGDSTLTASYLGTAADDATGRTVTDSGDKLWIDYALEINPPQATNVVGDDHTFTATLTVDTGQGFGPAAGETLQFTVDGQGDVIGGDVDDALTCTTDDAGECDIVINSDETGQTDVGVSYDAVVGATSATFADDAVKQWIDIDLVKTAVIGDGVGDGDLVADPETGVPTLFFTSSDQGPKTAVFEYVVTNTGPVTLQDVVLTDDRLGTIIDLADGVTLEPGASTTVRASEQYTYQDAAGDLDGLITNIGVVTANDGDGNEVTDTDDAVIALVAQQASILIDLVKDVVMGAGDVQDLVGIPTITWTPAEFAAGVTKTVRYRFLITNVGPSRLVDIELTDPMFGDVPIVSASDGVALDPGESTTVEADHELTTTQAFPDGAGGAAEVPNVATVVGANETRDAFDQDSDDAVVFVQDVFADTDARNPEDQQPAVLPQTGLAHRDLLPLSMLLIVLGVAILWRDRRGWATA